MARIRKFKKTDKFRIPDGFSFTRAWVVDDEDTMIAVLESPNPLRPKHGS